MKRKAWTVAGAAALLLTVCGAAWAQPANNACSAAQNLVVAADSFVQVNGTTIAATADVTGVDHCLSGTNSPDVWYTVTAPAAGTLTASTCTAASYDTFVGVYTGTGACPGTLIGCNDDTSGCGTRSSVTVPVTAGTVYRIRVAGYSGASGTFTLRVSHAAPPPPGIPPTPDLGPDVITSVVTDMIRYGTNTAGTITAYSVGTTSCNPGDYPVVWIDGSQHLPDYNDRQHPVIAQNIYRLKSHGAYSRLEQLGQGWLKHGFTSTNSGGCTPCDTSDSVWMPSTQQYENIGGDSLKVNCSDTYGASLNGSQTYLGPRSTVNSTLGTNTFDRGTSTGESTVRGRIQVPTADVTGQPVGTRFFAEGQYVCADDAQFIRPGQDVAFNSLNNASYREINATTLSNSAPSLIGSTFQQVPAIHAWKAADPAVTLVSTDHDDMPNPCSGFTTGLPGDTQYPPGTKYVRSRYWVAAKVTPLGGGLHRYEYAVFNLNSDRAAGTFVLPFPDSASAPTDFFFRAPLSHSGEPYSNAAWTMTKASNKLTFSTEAYSTNVNANAIRWGTMYNFGFTTDVVPTTGNATIGLFKPGTVGSPTSIDAVDLPVPTVSATCLADITEIGGTVEEPGTPDGLLTLDDILIFIDLYNSSAGCPGPAPCNRADITDIGNSGEGPDGLLTLDDILTFIDVYNDGCGF